MVQKKELNEREVRYLLDLVWALNEMLEQYIEEKDLEGIDRHAMCYYRSYTKDMEAILMTKEE